MKIIWYAIQTYHAAHCVAGFVASTIGWLRVYDGAEGGWVLAAGGYALMGAGTFYFNLGTTIRKELIK